MRGESRGLVLQLDYIHSVEVSERVKERDREGGTK